MVTEDCLNRVLPVVADSWTKLRRCDVDRLLNQIAYDDKESLLVAAGIVATKRPDLQKQIDQSVGWITEERGWDVVEPRASTNQKATLTIEFSGDLADSLRAIANLVDEHGPAFMSDPTAFFSIFNDGAVHRVDIDVSELDAAVRSVVNGEERCEHTGMTRDELESICGTTSEPTPLSVLRHHVSGAIERGEAVAIVEQPLVITEVIRNVNNGDCTLSAIRSDGSKIKLFSYYVDELAFADSELIGLTETQAHELHRKRDTAYLRS